MEKRNICQFLAQFDGRLADRKLFTIPFEEQIEFMVNNGYIRIENYHGFERLDEATIIPTDKGNNFYKNECDL